jgi:hypothetical protein
MSETDFNCDCEDVSGYETLSTLRARMMRRLGYAAQATNPPPGMAALIDEFLADAQRILYLKNPSLRTERYFRWTMTPGIRYYGYSTPDSEGDHTDISCDKFLQGEGIQWVGVEDTQGRWYTLRKGINPTWYTTVLQEGLPTHYDMRGCLEIFPAPNDSYKLWVRGRFAIEPFTADSDRTTIDDELVFLLALGNAKAHYGQPDAQHVLTQAGNYLLDLKAAKHGTRRYIPGAIQLPPAVQPTMTEFGDGLA